MYKLAVGFCSLLELGIVVQRNWVTVLCDALYIQFTLSNRYLRKEPFLHDFVFKKKKKYWLALDQCFSNRI